MPTPDDPRRGRSRALEAELRARIADGTHAAGAALPSSRAMAAERGLSRGTVMLVYEQLAADGLIETRAGAAARVAMGAADALRRARPGPSTAMPMAASTVASTAELTAESTAAPKAGPVSPPAAPPAPRLSAIGRRIAAMGLGGPEPVASDAPDPVIDFVYGPLAGADFPSQAWLKALRAAERQRPARLGYEDPRGHPALRLALQAHLSRTKALACRPGQIMVVNGSQQGLDLCARLLLDPGDPVVVENPGYRMAHRTFEACGARLSGVGVDTHGLRTEDLAAVTHARLACVTPSHQFPLGGCLPLARRQALLAWAAARQAWVIEDDYDSEYRHAVRPQTPLWSLDTGDRVIHVGTFSKTLSPQLRLGYLVLPEALVAPFVAARRLADRHGATAPQRALAALLADGRYDHHVRRMRRLQQARQRALVAALTQQMGRHVRIEGAASGLHLVAWFPALPAQAEPALVAAALAHGVRVHPVGPLYLPTDAGTAGPQAVPRCAGLVMGYALLDPVRIVAGVQGLAAARASIA